VTVLLEAKGLSVTFETPDGPVHAVKDVDLTIEKGTTVGLVGESGCGKSTLGRAILRLLPENARVTGSVMFNGIDLASLSAKDMRDIRGRNIAMIFQDPMTRLNPLMRIRDHFLETIRAHDPRVRPEDASKRALKVLADVRVPADRMSMYPHELSGGMRQRIMIALCLLFKPALLIADEPTTALWPSSGIVSPSCTQAGSPRKGRPSPCSGSHAIRTPKDSSSL
jgi:peptide/nickel transport system ATP-binding protein